MNFTNKKNRRIMNINYILTAWHSKRDKSGNVYWAFSFQYDQEKSVKATISGGESNIYAIKRYWNESLNDWDKTILFSSVEIPIREFKQMTKNWPYAGCSSKDLVTYIKNEIKRKND